MDEFGRRKNRRDVARPPIMRTPAALPKGPRLYQTPKNLGYKGPFIEPPPGFRQAKTSNTEWPVYAGLAKVTGYPINYREPPFIGMPGIWQYQKAVVSATISGATNIDFVLFAGDWSSRDVAFRIQTERHHIYNSAEVQFNDMTQLHRLAARMRVIDLYDQDFIWDPTGQAIVLLLKDSLSGSTYPNPITAGTTERATRIRPFST